jgi:hypothetical protein
MQTVPNAATMRLGQWLVVQSEEETELILKYRHEGNI